MISREKKIERLTESYQSNKELSHEVGNEQRCRSSWEILCEMPSSRYDPAPVASAPLGLKFLLGEDLKVSMLQHIAISEMEVSHSYYKLTM